jgi:polygalacturonase
MTLWCIARSPLILGADMTKLDAFTLSLLTNSEVLAVNQRSAANRQLFNRDGFIGWIADAPESPDSSDASNSSGSSGASGTSGASGSSGANTKYLALFNTTETAAAVPVAIRELGFSGTPPASQIRIRDLWKKSDLPASAITTDAATTGAVTTGGGTFAPQFPAHGAGLYRIQTTGGDRHSFEDRVEHNLTRLADTLTRDLKEWKIPDRVFRVKDHGALGDGKTVNTAALQKTIDACSAAGGGTVLVSDGEYVTGTIELKTNVMLHVAENAKILGSTNLDDYPDKVESFKSVMSDVHRYRISLIYAEKAANVGICGKGEIYFRGEQKNFPGPETISSIEGRPFGIRMIECRNIVLKDITLRNSAAWMQSYLCCHDMIFDGIKVFNHANYNNDALDPDGCKNIIVRNCFFSSHDDAMCLKGASAKPCENILIENSTFHTTCNALKLGTDTQGDFRNIIARNLTLGGLPDGMESFKNLYECSTGITLATVDGGNVENIFIENVTINRSRCPVFIRIGSRGRRWNETMKQPGHLKDVVIRNITGTENRRQGSLVSGIKDQVVESVLIKNMDISMIGGGTAEMANQPLEENDKGYPDAQAFSREGLPAHGFYIRHARNVTLENVKITPGEKDRRPEFKSGGNVENVVINGLPLDE